MRLPIRPRPLVAAAVIVLPFAAGSAGVTAQQPIPLDTLRVVAGSRVVAGAASITRSVEVLDRAHIEALPARTVADLLARALGVDLLARSAAQADLSIRGSGFEQVLVMVDGVPVNDDQTGHFHLNVAVPLESIERIEVLRGPASALYGSAAVGGVINIVTRRAGTELVARAQAGSFGAAAAGADAALHAGAWALRLGVERDRADGHRPGTDHDIVQTRLAADAPLAGGALQAHVAYAARDFGAARFYAPFDSYEETRALTAALSWRSAPAVLTVEPRVSVRRHEDDFVLQRDDPAFYRNVHTGLQTAAELVGRWAPAPGLGLAAGGEVARSTLDSSNLGDRAEDRVAAFAELAAGSAGATLVTLGVRLDLHSAFGSFASPSIAAGFRAPSFTERYYTDPANIGNPELDAEKFWTAEVGAELRAGGASLDVAGFVRRASDLIDWGRPAGADESEPWRTMNLERATFRGVEATARAPLGAAQLTTRAALLDFSAEAEPGFASKYALRPLTRSLGVALAAPLPGGIRLHVDASHRRRAGETPQRWELLDLRLSRTLAAVRGLELHIDATNLLDAAWEDVAGQPAPGRAIGVGGRIRR